MGKIGSELLKLDGLVAEDASLVNKNNYEEMLRTLKSINNVEGLSPQQQALMAIDTDSF